MAFNRHLSGKLLPAGNPCVSCCCRAGRPPSVPRLSRPSTAAWPWRTLPTGSPATCEWGKDDVDALNGGSPVGVNAHTVFCFFTIPTLPQAPSPGAGTRKSLRWMASRPQPTAPPWTGSHPACRLYKQPLTLACLRCCCVLAAQVPQVLRRQHLPLPDRRLAQQQVSSHN